MTCKDGALSSTYLASTTRIHKTARGVRWSARGGWNKGEGKGKAKAASKHGAEGKSETETKAKAKK